MTGHVLIFGAGYTGMATATAARDAGWRVTVTSRSAETAARVEGVAVIGFDRAGSSIAAATHLLATAPPGGDGDPVLHAHAAAIAGGTKLRWAGYFSTTGVYGDRAGGWVDEATPPAPGNPRSVQRVAAEAAWAALSGRMAVDLFRIAGIYGPGRSPFAELRAGRGRRVDRPGHAFGRIHRDDISGAVLAAIGKTPPPGVRVLNLCDDLPAASADVIAHAAGLLGLPPPPLVPFEAAFAAMSPMARSFWAENRRVRSAATQAALGYRWRYPDYRSGLASCLAEEGAEGRERR